ncbi:MAG: hypothetical protein ACUVQ8_06635 [Nitrososphaeria archaeon]
MSVMPPSKAEDILGKRTLILGDVGKGKTRLTAKLLHTILEKTSLEDVTVVDMAPSTYSNIGRRLSEYSKFAEKTRYFHSKEIKAPRLEGSNAKEVLEIADHNRRVVEEFLEMYLEKPTSVLIINDLTIYLHSGEISKVTLCMNSAKTFIANAYYGEYLKDDKGSNISSRERALVESISSKCDIVVKL